MVRQGQRMEAVKHARKYFSVVEPEHLHKVQQLMGLLAFTENTKVSPYMVCKILTSLTALYYVYFVCSLFDLGLYICDDHHTIDVYHIVGHMQV